MQKRKHLIIGCGSAGLSALEQIRRLNSEDEIKIVTMEDFPPYSPTLLPYLLSGRIDEGHLLMREENYFVEMKATLVRGKTITRVLPETKRVVYADGQEEAYDTLLIASGSEAVKPPIKGLNGNTFLGFHTIADCTKLLKQLAGKSDVAVLGAGLVGMEVAIGLVERGCRVTVLEKEPRLLPLYFDQEAEVLIRGIFTAHGIQLLTGREVSEVNRENRRIEINFARGEPVQVDVLITCIGVKARTSFATETGIAVNQGILVDRRMRTNMEDIYAAGDVAETADFFSGKLGMNPTIPSAIEQGEVAGSNMAGVEAEYEGWISTNIFHLFGNTAFSAGISMPDSDNYQVLTEKNERKVQFKRLIYDDDTLVGAMFINIDLDPGVILYLIRNRVGIGSHKQQLFEQPKEISRWLMQEAEHHVGPAGAKY